MEGRTLMLDVESSKGAPDIKYQISDIKCQNETFGIGGIGGIGGWLGLKDRFACRTEIAASAQGASSQ